jgi:hypothetical protein
MAKPSKRAPIVDDDDERIEVKAAATFRYDGVYVRPGQRVRMTPKDVADYRALHWVEPIGRGTR